MNSIYLYDGPFERGEKGWDLIRMAAARHGAETGMETDFFQVEMVRDEKGKPFFADTPLEFSLSHSGLLWLCMFSDRPCGLDLQVVKECSWEDIARRQFTEDEQHYARIWGIDGFFDVWVRKEAFCKCTGQGLFSPMPPVVDSSMDLVKSAEWDGLTYYFTDIDIAPDLKCCACTMEQEKIEMRILA